MTRWFRVYVVNQIERFLMPIAALAQSSPFSGAHVPGRLHKRTRRMIARKKTAHHPLSPSPDNQGHKGAGSPRQAQPEQGEIAMRSVQQWGRRESIIWPPRHYLYALAMFRCPICL
jgi:hypothetical protein